jgi:hypothetical protein
MKNLLIDTYLIEECVLTITITHKAVNVILNSSDNLIFYKIVKAAEKCGFPNISWKEIKVLFEKAVIGRPTLSTTEIPRIEAEYNYNGTVSLRFYINKEKVEIK